MSIALQVLELSNWKGLNTLAPLTDCDPQYVVDCQNVDFDDDGAIAKRRSCIRKLALSGRVNMIIDFQNQQGFSSTTDRSRVVIAAGTTLSVVANFDAAGQTVSATFSVTNQIHYAAVTNNGACFISNEGGGVPNVLCYTGGSFRYVTAALSAPTAAPDIAAGSTGSLTGSGYGAIYTYQDIFGNESNPSAKPVGITLSNQNLDVGIVASADITVSQVNLYVKTPSISVYKLAMTNSNTSGTVSVTYADNVIAGGTDANYDHFECPAGKFVVIYNDMLIVGGSTTLPDLIYPSNWQYPRQFSTGLDYDRVTSGDGQPVKGFGRLLSSLIVAKAKSIYVAEGEDNTTFHTKAYDPEYGVLGQPSITFFRRRLAYFSDDGIYVDNGMVPEELSMRIRRTLRSLNPFNLAVNPPKQICENYKYYKKLYWAVREATGSGENDTILVYNYERDTWTKYKGIEVTAMGAVHAAMDYEMMYGGDSNGNIFEFMPPNGGSPNSDNITGSTASISAYAETPWMNLPKLKGFTDWERSKTHAPWFMIYAGGEPATGKSTISIVTNYYTDFSSVIRGTFTTTHNATAWPTVTCDPKVVKFGGTVAQFKWIKFKFTNNNLDEHFRIEKVAIGFRPKPAPEY
jgi:hypothetical protein